MDERQYTLFEHEMSSHITGLGRVLALTVTFSLWGRFKVGKKRERHDRESLKAEKSLGKLATLSKQVGKKSLINSY